VPDGVHRNRGLDPGPRPPGVPGALHRLRHEVGDQAKAAAGAHGHQAAATAASLGALMSSRMYATVSPKLWTGETAQQLRAEPPHVYLLACYFVTCPHANMIGAFVCPKLYITNETGIPRDDVDRGVVTLQRFGFLTYDDASSYVWVIEMGRYQVAERLSLGDKRRKPIVRMIEDLPARLRAAFVGRYGVPWALDIDVQSTTADPAHAAAVVTPDVITTMDQLEPWGYRRFRHLRGEAIAALRNLLPIPRHELEAVDGSNVYAWLGAARVIQRYREEAAHPTRPATEPSQKRGSYAERQAAKDRALADGPES
jgi:hypothetical protein